VIITGEKIEVFRENPAAPRIAYHKILTYLPGIEPELRAEEPSPNRLSYITARAGYIRVKN
jgi:hypothetical protein